MGITIHAKGKIDCLDDIHQLTDEVKGIAEVHGWKYVTIDDAFEVDPDAVMVRPDAGESVVIDGTLGLKGIVLSFGSKAESMAILFDRNGVLTDMLQQLFRSDHNEQDECFTSCKTQFAGMDTHILIIELLDVLKNRYITDLTVIDEGGYWESRDSRMLADKFAVIEHYLGEAKKIIGSIDCSDREDQSSERLASQIEDAFLEADKADKSLH